VTRNVERDDYVGSEACRTCHPDVVAAWEASPMHRMTRDARGAEIRAPFDGARFRFKDDVAVFERRGGDRYVRLELAGARAQEYRVTRVIGGRAREDFAGVDVAGAGTEVVLPVSFVFATGAFRYKGYSVMVHERASLRAGPVWNRACIFCHNTVPELDRLLAAIALPRPPPYQGEIVDPWLPREDRTRVRVRDPDAFAAAWRTEAGRLGAKVEARSGSASDLAREAIAVVREHFDGASLVETGVGCEACHGGALQHTRDPKARPLLLPVAPWLDVRLRNAGPATATNRVCARCHQVLFSRYPFTWEGGRRDGDAGGSTTNSGEARDFLLGACSKAMACTACHDPHGGDRRTVLALATPAGNAVCTKCHAELADTARLRAHAHHDPGGAAGSCIACHMPRKNMGLDGSLTRYHRIGSPTDAVRVLGDRPLECALCHADRSVGQLIDRMESWWPVRYPRQRLEELYGSLEANALRATLERGKPHERAVAIAVLGESGARDVAPAIARELLDDYPLVREWAKRALVALLGTCEVDLAATDDAIAAQARACTGVSPSRPGPSPASPDEDPED
jgi:predicted CXXCH cytochrome family protein